VVACSRRQFVGSAVAALGGTVMADAHPARAQQQAAPGGGTASEPFSYALNTSTLRGHGLDLVAEIELLSKIGYAGVEPWIQEIDAYTKAGGTLEELGRRFADAGLTVENAIGFATALHADSGARAKGLEQLRVDMDKVARIGGKRIAMPPGFGQGVTLDDAVTCYREALELGRSMGVTPLFELWGTHELFGPLKNGIYVTTAVGDPDASLLLDVFHLYRSGTSFDALHQINGAALHVIHMNDVPATPERAELEDSHRLYPGDGNAPFGDIFRTLRDNGFRGALSVELFNKEYWQKAAEDNARTALEKMRAAVQAALA
jgi:2-keto-myo-inositol isomerase